MSEQSGGPGWWQASDGKWYPPEQAPTGAQPEVGPTPAGAAPYPAAAAAAGGGGGAGKIIAIVVAAVVVVGAAAFFLTRDSGGGNSLKTFCDKSKAFPNDISLSDAFSDQGKADTLLKAFDDVTKAAPKEIKADITTLNDAAKREIQAVKDGKNPQDAFNEDERTKVVAASKNVADFEKKNCGIDFGAGSTDSSSSTRSSSSSSRSSSSSSRSSSSSSSSSDSSSSAGSVFDSIETRDELVASAQKTGAVQNGEVQGWADDFPDLSFIGSARPATDSAVSGFAIVTSKTKNVDFLAFAVSDFFDDCAGAVLEFDSTGTTVTKVVTVDTVTGDCTGDAIAESQGY